MKQLTAEQIQGNWQIMAKNKQPLHIKNKLKQFELKDGTKFWAKHKEDAKLYIKKVEGK